MLPVDFEGTNIEFTRPKEMTDESCSSVRAFVGIDDEKTPFILTAWQPNYEDIVAIKAGRPIMLKVCGAGMPPVILYTYDEQIKANV